MFQYPEDKSLSSTYFYFLICKSGLWESEIYNFIFMLFNYELVSIEAVILILNIPKILIPQRGHMYSSLWK